MCAEKGFYMQKPGGKIIFTEPMKSDGIAFCEKRRIFTLLVSRRGEIKCPKSWGTFNVFQITNSRLNTN